jgi:SAM-dependent methyltransferase
MRNDLTIYDKVADRWWSDDIRWVRTLKNLVPGRLKWFDRQIDWQGKAVLDLGCAGGFMAEALAARGADVTGIDPASDAIDAARVHSRATGLRIGYDVGVWARQTPFIESRPLTRNGGRFGRDGDQSACVSLQSVIILLSTFDVSGYRPSAAVGPKVYTADLYQAARRLTQEGIPNAPKV